MGIAARELGERDGRDRLCVRPLHEVLLAASPAEEATASDGACSDDGNYADQQQPAVRRRFCGVV